jgi:thiol-disulfide isomerase/thioredoxin
VQGHDGGKIYLSYNIGWHDNLARDSSSIVDGCFLFRGEVRGATTASISLIPKPATARDVISFWIEEGEMTIDMKADDLTNYTLTGSRSNDESKEPEAWYIDITRDMPSLSEAAKKETDPARRDAIQQQMTALRAAAIEKLTTDFIDKHPESHVTAYWLLLFRKSFSLEELEARYNALADRVKEGVMGVSLGREVRQARAGAPGSKAFLFTRQEDINGQPFQLASLVGKKYILLDFWASWCVPCRASNPHMKEMYQKYKDALCIVCISDDDKTPDKWRAAVEQDGLQEFYHVLRGLKHLRGGGFDRSDDISGAYDVHAIPTKVLIDLNGTIIGRYTGDSNGLDEQLKEVFGR